MDEDQEREPQGPHEVGWMTTDPASILLGLLAAVGIIALLGMALPAH